MSITKRHYIVTAIASYLLILIITIPAKTVTGLFDTNTAVNLQGVNGTLWNGKARLISVNNTQLEKTTWSFNLLKLFIGKLSVDIHATYLGHVVRAELGSSFLGRYFVNDLQTRIPAEKVAKLINIPLAQLDGSISLDIQHAQWKQGELPLASGEITWTNATITVADTVSLGNINILLSESEQQLLFAEIKNQGGEIKITGSAELVPEAEYSVDITLSPAAGTNNNIKQSLGLFAKKQANGEYVFKQSGSLNQIMQL